MLRTSAEPALEYHGSRDAVECFFITSFRFRHAAGNHGLHGIAAAERLVDAVHRNGRVAFGQLGTKLRDGASTVGISSEKCGVAHHEICYFFFGKQHGKVAPKFAGADALKRTANDLKFVGNGQTGALRAVIKGERFSHGVKVNERFRNEKVPIVTGTFYLNQINLNT